MLCAIFKPNEAAELEGRPNTAARLAGWRTLTQLVVILYVMDGPSRLSCRTFPSALVAVAKLRAVAKFI
jgi:hypothetical protein